MSASRLGMGRRHGRHGEHGQMIVIFALCLIVITAMAGLLVDGGMAWSNRRQAQAAADTAALAAAKDISAKGTGTSAAQAVAGLNGFGAGTDCNGVALLNNGVTVNLYKGSLASLTSTLDPTQAKYVEVITTRAMHTTFAAAVGQGCWMVSSRAVASIGSSSVASCSFCSLNNTQQNHTILLQNGASLRVDGDIYTNSYSGCVSTSTVNGLVQCNDAALCAMKDWKACGDGFDVFGTPPVPPAYISAKTISVVGGWETHDQNIVIADSRLAPPDPRTTCLYAPTPLDQLIADPRASNVCIHMPPIVDPFAGVPAPTVPTRPTPASCSSGTAFPAATGLLTIGATKTLCPGLYPGGIKITGSGTIATLLSGVYYIQTGGFAVVSGASVNSSDGGVMIFNTGGGAVNISQLEAGVDIPPNPDLVVVTSNPNTLTAAQATFSPLPPNNVNPGNVQYQFMVTQPAGKPQFWGTVTFYDGSTDITSLCNAPANLSVSAKGTFTAKCTIAYTLAATQDELKVGTHGISAVYSSAPAHPDYNDAQAILSPREVIKSTGAGGTTALKAMSSGPYAGFVIWQDKNSNVNMVISPQSALPDCSAASATWMTDGVPGTAQAGNPVPPPCGDMGGIQGTIYAGNSTAQVQVTANGVTDLQIIAGRILVTNGVNARFAFKPGEFALGNIRLVE